MLLIPKGKLLKEIACRGCGVKRSYYMSCDLWEFSLKIWNFLSDLLLEIGEVQDFTSLSLILLLLYEHLDFLFVVEHLCKHNAPNYKLYIYYI